MSFAALILKNLLRQRVRTSLTVLGISLGITTVVAMGVVTNSLKSSIGEIIVLGGADFMVAQEGAADLSFSTLPQDTVQTLAGVAGIERAEGVLFHVSRLGPNPYFFLMGREPESLAAAAPEELEGSLLTPGASDEIMLGRRAADDLDAAVGDDVTIEDRQFRVVGV